MRRNRRTPRATAAADVVVCVLVALLIGAAPTSASGGSVLSGIREDPGRPGMLRLVIGFSGTPMSANRVTAAGFRHTAGDPTTLASASLTVTGARVARIPVLRAQDGTLVRAATSGSSSRITIDPRDGRYKYLYYEIPDPRHILIIMWLSRVPRAPAYVPGGFPRGSIVIDHTIRRPGSITAVGLEHGIFEHQFSLALRTGIGRRFERTTVHAVNGRWTATLTYRVAQPQWGTLEAVAFSAKDSAITAIAQIAVKLQNP